MANPAATSSGDASQWVTFALAGEVYGIDVMQVQEVLRMTPIAPVPGGPHFVIGIVNLRGNVVTVVDTRARFGLLPAETDDSTRIIIVDAQNQVVGLLVDSVAEVIEVPIDKIESPPILGGEDRSKFIKGVQGRGDELLILVDLHQLLLQEDPLGG